MSRCINACLLIAVLTGCSAQTRSTPDLSMNLSIQAKAETTAVLSVGDAADDPAIWLHPTEPGRSIILGTDKQAALHAFDLAGNQIQRLDVAINNVDVRQGVPMGGQSIDIAAGSLSGVHGFTIFTIDGAAGNVEELKRFAMPARGNHSYGVCLGVLSRQVFVFITDYYGSIEQWRLTYNDSGELNTELAATFALPTQTEGCVVDDERGVVYFSEESEGVWRFPANPEVSGEGELIARVGENQLAEDVEGLALYETINGAGFLMVSSQGNNRFNVYERSGDNSFLASMTITASDTVDGVTETDGIAAFAGNLGVDFPAGLFVVQDGQNTSPDTRQNFKLIDWREISAALDLSEPGAR